MKTKQGNIIKACKVLDKYNGRNDIPMKLGFEMFQLKSKLSTYWDFQVKKEQEVFGKYKYNVDAKGDMVFDTPEDKEAFNKEYIEVCNELADQDVDIPDFAKQTIHLRDDVNMSPGDIAALAEFAAFVE